MYTLLGGWGLWLTPGLDEGVSASPRASRKIKDLPSWGYHGDDSVEVDWGMSAVTWGPSEVTQTPPLIWLYGECPSSDWKLRSPFLGFQKGESALVLPHMGRVKGEPPRA